MKTEQREEGTPAFSTAPAIVATMAWFSTYLGGRTSGCAPKEFDTGARRHKPPTLAFWALL